jgi:hypothetical protein
MLDDFRQQAEESNFEEQETQPEARLDVPDTDRRFFLGMTPVQRFVISLELLFTVCLIGVFVLLVLERIVPPFLN